MADLLDISAPLGETWSGGVGRRPWLRSRAHARGKKERRGRRKEWGEKRDTAVEVVLIPSVREQRRRWHASLRRSTAGMVTGRCLPLWRRAGLGPVWAVISCPKAADKREIREDLGRIWPGEKDRDFFLYPLFYFCYFVFKTFAQFEFTQECKTTL
jgi:hypothetical protein